MPPTVSPISPGASADSDRQLPALDRPTLNFRQVPLGAGQTAWNIEVTYPQFLSRQESQALKMEFAGPTLANVVDRVIESLLDRPGEGAGAAQKTLLERPLSVEQLAEEIVALAPVPVLAALLCETRKDTLRQAIWRLLEALGFRPGQVAHVPSTELVAALPARLIRRVTPIKDSTHNGSGDDVSE